MVPREFPAEDRVEDVYLFHLSIQALVCPIGPFAHSPVIAEDTIIDPHAKADDDYSDREDDEIQGSIDPYSGIVTVKHLIGVIFPYGYNRKAEYGYVGDPDEAWRNKPASPCSQLSRQRAGVVPPPFYSMTEV